MLQEACELLKQKSAHCLQVVADDEFMLGYTNEKIRHSLQVMGAGAYLVRRVKWLRNKPDSYIDMVKTAILLHDICRFAEIEEKYLYQHQIDHGVAGAEFLRNIIQFSDIRIWLPIKHHGHFIDCLYEDAEYQNIADNELRREVEQICFIIRDADKIANLHLFLNEPKFRYLFLEKNEVSPEVDGAISEQIKAAMYDNTTINKSAACTAADRVAGYLSWYFDINYCCALEFCNKLKVTEGFIAYFEWLCTDADFKQKYVAHLRDYLQTHPFLE